MTELQRLITRIVERVNVNLRETTFDVAPYIYGLIAPEKFSKFYAFYGITLHHPLHLRFNDCSVAGSFFLGKCDVAHSIVYKTDVRGDELKGKGDTFKCGERFVPVLEDEAIRIRHSFLMKTLIHSNSHDPESPEEFAILNTASMHYANIHGSPIEGSFLGSFATVDLTTVHDCVIGDFAYVQTGELAHHEVPPGKIWVKAGNAFEFTYLHPEEVLDRYVHTTPGQPPRGLFHDFLEAREKDYEAIFDAFHAAPRMPIPRRASLSRYAVLNGECFIEDNVLVAQRSYIENAWMGKGSNAQENCYIVDSRLDGCDVTAHGGKVIHAHLGKTVFVGFNCFLRGTLECPLDVGPGCIFMPHTVIDLEECLSIPPNRLVWGFIRNASDLESHSVALDDLARVDGEFKLGAMTFRGSGGAFVKAFRHRIEHILEANGAFCDGDQGLGHAQKGQNISYNIIQPYPEGRLKGLYPTIEIKP